jgi:hypothetical protein
VAAGVLAFYLVGTAWMAARRRERRTGAFDVAALLAVLALAAFELTSGIQAATSPTHMKAGYPPRPYFFTAVAALLFAASDVRMLLRGGVDARVRWLNHPALQRGEHRARAVAHSELAENDGDVILDRPLRHVQ